MKRHYKKLAPVAWLVAVLLTLLAVKTFAGPDRTELVFVGSGNKNISAFRLNLTSGGITSIGERAQVAAPSFLTPSPNQKFLYAISEGAGRDSSFVSAFRI